jgi:L-ascorbate metabolism protein UlaG (beta-lactamase superfamily)
MIEVDNILIYFPGDTAIGPHFQEIHRFFGRSIDLFFGPIGPQEPKNVMRANHING